MKQQTIKVPEPKRDFRSLHEILLSILQEFGPRKHEALIEALGASKGHFSEVLAGKKHWPQDWIDYVVDNFDFRNDVASYYARRRGMRICPPRAMSAREWKQRVSYVLGQHNAMGRALVEEALALPEELFGDEDEGAAS